MTGVCHHTQPPSSVSSNHEGLSFYLGFNAPNKEGDLPFAGPLASLWPFPMSELMNMFP
jgi:hypothetical protein